MKKSVILVFAGILIFALSAFGQQPGASVPSLVAPAPGNANVWDTFKPITITFATANGIAQTIETMNQNWMKVVTERSGGKINFDYFPGAQLGSYMEIIEQVNVGSIAMSVTDISMYESYAHEFAVLYYPYLIDSYAHAGRIMYGEGGKILKEALAKQTKTYLLGVVQHGQRVTATVSPIKKVEDCKNIIMRTPEAQVYIDWTKGLGMSSLPMAMSEAYTAIQTGVAQGIELPIQALQSNGYTEVAPNVWKDAHMYAFQGLNCNQTWWNALPNFVQELMISTWENLQEDYNTFLLGQEDSVYAKLIKEGRTVTECDYRDQLRTIYKDSYVPKAKAVSESGTALLKAIELAR